MKQFIVKQLVFNKKINRWVTSLDDGQVIYSHYPPVYNKGDVIKYEGRNSSKDGGFREVSESKL